MRAEAAALWRAILAAPLDDAPRLIYADWLDEHGRPERAEFIRVQCELARDGLGLVGNPARQRAADLWDRHSAEWRAELPGRLRRFPFHRGFVHPERVLLSPKALLRVKPGLFAAAPLWDVAFSPGSAEELGKLVGSSRLRAIDVLELLSPPAPALAAFLNGGPLDHLRSLQLSGLHGWGELGNVRPGRLPHLRRLGLTGGSLDRAGAERVAASGLIPILRTVALAATRLEDDGFRALFASSNLFLLNELRVTDCQLTPGGLSALVENPMLSRLHRLILAWNPIGDEGARELALWPGLRSVQHLDLRQTNLGPVGAEALIRSSFLQNVRTLSLAANRAVHDPVTRTRLRTRFGPALLTGPGSGDT